MSHGVLLPEALELTSQTVAPGSILAREIQSAYHRIIAGEKPGDAFQSIQTLPPLARRLLAGGDAAGNLAEAWTNYIVFMTRNTNCGIGD